MNRSPELPGEAHCGDAPVFLLGLLDERQADVFLAHARSCTVCNDELEALAPAVDVLPTTVPRVSAPGHVKRRVMRVVRTESGLDTHRQRADRTRRWPMSILRVSVRPARVFAVAMVLLLVIGVPVGVLLASAPPGGRTARVAAARVTLAGASAALHQNKGHAWLTVSGMPQPARGHVYEVWVKQPGDRPPRPAGSLFTPTAVGGGMVAVSEDLRPGSQVMVTTEPTGGTLVPSGSPVIVVRVS